MVINLIYTLRAPSVETMVGGTKQYHAYLTCWSRSLLAGVTSLWIIFVTAWHVIESRTTFHRCNHCGSKADMFNAYRDQTMAKFPDTFTNAPSLTHVEVINYVYRDFEIDWSNVTYLYLDGFTDLGPPLSLPQAINLNTLVVESMRTGHFQSLYDKITLQCLESWNLACNHWLRHIRAPALQNLSLYRIPVTKIEINDVTSFLRESGCKLARLALAYIEEPSSSLVDILRHAPELVHLAIVGDVDDDIAASIELLSVPIPSDVVGSELPAPRLQSLRVGLCRDPCTDRIIDGLSNILLLRNRQVATNGSTPVERLQSLILEMDINHDERLRRHCEALGVDLGLMVPPSYKSSCILSPERPQS